MVPTPATPSNSYLKKIWCNFMLGSKKNNYTADFFHKGSMVRSTTVPLKKKSETENFSMVEVLTPPNFQ